MTSGRQKATPTIALLLSSLCLYGCDSNPGGPNSQGYAPMGAVPQRVLGLGSKMRLRPDTLGLIGGARDIQREHALHLVRGAALLDSGIVVVGTEGAQALRFYDSSGNYIITRGRSGAGPGEFRRLRSLQRLGRDSIVVWDAGLRRFTFLRRGVADVRTVPLADLGVTNLDVPARTQPLDVFATGKSFIIAYRAVAVERPPGFSRDSVYLAFIIRPDSDVTLVGPVLGTEFFREKGTMAAPL